jgi:putative flippase GtrA
MAQLMKQNNQSILNGSVKLVVSLPKMLSKKTVRQFIKYGIAGLVSLAAELSLLYFFTEVVKLWYIYSNSLALFVALIINFSLNRFWVFCSQQSFVKQFVTSGTLFAINLVAENVLMYSLTDIAHLYYLFSKILTTGMSVLWDFFLYKYIIYK